MAFNINAEEVLNGLAELDLRAQAGMKLYADTAAKKLEKEAKESSPWTDRTGLSRKTISSGVENKGDKCHVYVAGNTEHFPYLELCNDKKYATLKPSLDKLSPEILAGMNKLLGK